MYGQSSRLSKALLTSMVDGEARSPATATLPTVHAAGHDWKLDRVFRQNEGRLYGQSFFRITDE